MTKIKNKQFKQIYKISQDKIHKKAMKNKIQLNKNVIFNKNNINLK